MIRLGLLIKPLSTSIPGVVTFLKLKKSWKNSTKKLATLLISFLIAGLAVTPALAGQLRSPWLSKKASAEKKYSTFSAPGLAFDFYVGLFQRYISPVDGSRCQLYPTCSRYARICLQKHGAITGFFMSADRLMRDNWGIAQYHSLILHHDRLYYYDPVVANDFWLH